jgi:hypothetical protein
MDTVGDIPEYEGYSLTTDMYDPLVGWEKKSGGFETKAPYAIENKNEFVEMSNINKTIMLEITEKGKNTKP